MDSFKTNREAANTNEKIKYYKTYKSQAFPRGMRSESNQFGSSSGSTNLLVGTILGTNPRISDPINIMTDEGRTARTSQNTNLTGQGEFGQKLLTLLKETNEQP